jgi:hypothetical protein
MPPAEAAAELAGMYSLCFDEDLAGEIASELQLDREKARAIAAELVKLRGAAPLLIMKRSMRRSIKRRSGRRNRP